MSTNRIFLSGTDSGKPAGFRFPAALFLAIALALPACVYVASVPGGGDTANERTFKSVEDLKLRIGALKEGMTEEEAFLSLGAPREAFTVIDPEDLWRIGLGRSLATAGAAPGWNGFARLTGYRLRYKSVSRQHGLSSPIRIQTVENGFSYELTLIFHDGKLLEKPILSGGMVSETRSRTLFDYVTPGTALNHALP